jgi:uncharacterized protein (DUF433 family)
VPALLKKGSFFKYPHKRYYHIHEFVDILTGYTYLWLMFKDIINIDPEIMSGAPVFTGTRVPIKALFDYVESGKTLDEFFEDFPSVKHSQAVNLLSLAQQLLISANEKATA